MSLDLFTVFENLAGLFMLIAAGFAAVRLKALEPDSTTQLTAFLMKITLPSTIFISLVSREYDPGFLKLTGIMLAAGIIIYPLLLYTAYFLTPLFRVGDGAKGVWSFAAAFPNNGFMGFPVILSLLGPDALALAVVFGIPTNIIFYTLGAMMLCRDIENGKAGKLDLKKALATPVNAAMVLSLIFYFGQIPLPKFVTMPITYFSNVTTPLSMFLTGMTLGKSRGMSLFTDCNAYTSTFVKLIIYPLASFFVLRLIPFPDPYIVPVIVLTMAMPAASITTVLALNYNANTTLASRIVFISSLLCMVTMPFICMLL